MEASVFCIGGLGGSGTRLVSKVLLDHGVNIGSALNNSLDNLFFTLFFRRPSWFKNFPSSEELYRAIGVFKRNMNSGSEDFYSKEDELYTIGIITSNDISIYTQKEWMLHISQHFNESGKAASVLSTWGWKEPNTHVFLPQLNESIPKLKYIHVIRDGLYMMSSRNQNQLIMWAKHFNINNDIETTNPSSAFDYWLAANTRALEIASGKFGERFYLADYDRICINPSVEVERLLKFLEVEPSRQKIEQLKASINYRSISADEIKMKQGFLTTIQVKKHEQFKSLVRAFH